jgi:enamine deaminase RidA (YjgF/YER057c/UK114 family)
MNRREVVAGTGAAAVALAVAQVTVRSEAAAPGQEKGFRTKAIQPASVPPADASYSPGLLAAGSQVLFISGQGPRDHSAEPEVQIRQTFEKIQAVLQGAGASWRNVVMIRSYFVNMKRDLPLLRKVRREFLVEPYPASTAVGVTELAMPDLQVEIEAVAML